ncbi:MAG: hypothetical protein QOG59_2874 [Solirubrobacteraceae bacterium]|nr:hypothetical protein [Solirubrobacteraceae bacterium]
MTSEPTGATGGETFARTDPQCSIDPTLGPGVVDWALGWAVDLPGRGRALEIGCGVGRNTVHLARHFGHVDGVDVTATMVHSARQRALAPNVRLHALSGRDLQPLPDGVYDLVFSHLGFQHIAAESDIAGYLRETGRVLRRGGVAVLQFDTRPSSRLVSLFQRLPDAARLGDRRASIRGHRRSAQAIRAAGAAGGLALEAEHDPATADHFMRWRKP